MAERPEIPWRLLQDVAEGRADPLELEVFEASLRADGLEEPPPWVLNRAVRIARKVKEAPQPGFLRRLMAQLVYDSWLQPQPAGVRQGEVGTRRLLYQSEQMGIDLEVKPQVALVGQILPEAGPLGPLAGTEVRLQRERQLFARTQADANGQFAFEAVAPGVYDLTISLPEAEIEINGLEI